MQRSPAGTDLDQAEGVLHEMAARIREYGSLQASEFSKAAEVVEANDDPTDPGRDTLFRVVLGLAIRLTGAVLGSIRVLVGIAIVLALVDVGLLVVVSDALSEWWLALLLALPILLVPAFLLNLAGKRFAALRDAMTTIGHRLPELVEIPRQMMGPLTEIADHADDAAGKGRVRRLVSTARLLLRFKRVFNEVADEHRELLGAGTTVISYGPRDVLYITWGSLGLLGLAFGVPVFGVMALLTLV
ncbi:MAG: hypothetical protein OSA99_06380 [Acidimicrobiales bacterium]|nr:hypothetical protein [Acidimicrobiales bacterium]